MNTAQQFYAHCGEIVLVSTSIEHTLGQHLTVFLLRGKPLNVFQVEDKFSEEKFDNKIRLLANLCETRNIKSVILLKALGDIKKARNSVAHWGASYDPRSDQFRLNNRTLKKLKREPLDTSKAVKEVNENQATKIKFMPQGWDGNSPREKSDRY